jgi:two-component system nitrogen regulation sensor histidine kinase NtrY
MLRDTNYIGALIKLKGYDDAYLFVARFIDPAVLEQIQQTESSIQGCANLEYLFANGGCLHIDF